ncbi:hypothetical protein VA596_03115 [Amycolatopsis sp., V23-08]|uniref:Uncharacterized protein n=1 Tax=Amycolatopsis heterodermiae TaxID=3110235 RepID=A0ABU5QX59_9PSEU|nr:hypothetical protein [Amycolatopsis sp., V23-08]MEA5358513.1 hypothetical protein [Amycolatopsis sp., V23-08]
MTIVEVERHGLVAIGEDDHPAAYPAAEWLRSSRPAIGAVAKPVRMHVEVLRRFGGLAPRALVGGQFMPGQGDQTQFAVAVANFDLFDADEEPTCTSELWKEPFTVGLPSGFARAVASTLGERSGLPAGTLTIDRAGFDLVNSSEMIFGQAAAVLKAAMAAQLSGQDAVAAARSLVSTW